jgi:hypothetical protein
MEVKRCLRCHQELPAGHRGAKCSSCNSQKRKRSCNRCDAPIDTEGLCSKCTEESKIPRKSCAKCAFAFACPESSTSCPKCFPRIVSKPSLYHRTALLMHPDKVKDLKDAEVIKWCKREWDRLREARSRKDEKTIQEIYSEAQKRIPKQDKNTEE